MFEIQLGSLATCFVLGLAAILLLYRFSIRNHDYWKKRGVPYDKPIPLLGSIRQVFNMPAHEIERFRYNNYGQIHGYYEGSNANLTVGDPELIRDILVKDFSTFHTRRIISSGNEIFDKMLSVMKGDEDWKRIRSIITPTFTTGKIKRMMSILKDCSCTLVRNFRDASTKGDYIDAKRYYGAFTMDVIASSAFSTKIDSHNDPDNQFVKFASKVFLQKVNWRMFIFIVFPSLMKLFKIDFFPQDVINFFKKITHEIIDERKRTGQTRNDFLQLLMDTAKEVEEADNLDEKGDIATNYGLQEDINPQILKSVTSKKLSMNELVSQCVIFFIGGYDTTASTLSFATYFLALHPDIQDRVRQEVDKALKESNGKLTYEATQNMKYLDNVISETLRMYPPLIKTDRTAATDYRLGDTGITIPKGMIASIPIYALHRDPKVFPDPDKFIPESYYEGNKPHLSVGDPELIRLILVKDFSTFHTRRELKLSGNEVFDKMVSVMKGDEEWKRIRTIISPTFTTGKIKRMMSIFQSCSNTLVKNFRAESLDGKFIDAKRIYGAFTMDVIASSAFSTKLDSHNDPNNKFVQFASKALKQSFNWKLFLFIIFPPIAKVIKFTFFPPECMEFFKQITYEIIEERKKTGETPNDFLQLMMQTAKEVEDDTPEKGDITSNYGLQEDINPNILKSVTSKKLSMIELVSQCVAFFIAGYDTTASTLSFATYLLALNPDVQDKLRTEVDEALKESGGELTYEAIQSMKYLDNVISETLRMYPPLVRMDRTADADYKLGNTGINVPKGMLISIPTYAIHRDPNIFPDPDKFNPDRFKPEERAKRDPYTYHPFGAGPRNCIAMRFALMEVKVCLADVIANFRIKRCPETKVPLEFGTGQVILQPKGIILEMETRRDALSST